MIDEEIDDILITIVKEFVKPENFQRIISEQVLANAIFYSFAVGRLKHADNEEEEAIEDLRYVKIIESRIEKDAVIDKVLNTEYPDEDDLLCGLSEAVENKEIKEESKIQPLDIDTLIKVAAINNVLNGPIRRTPYPWNLNTYF